MSIRTQLEARIAANTPAGGNAAQRTKAVIMSLIRNFYPSDQAVDVASLPVCEWEDATEFIYLGAAHSLVVNGMVSPVHYGKRVNISVASVARECGMSVIPINANAPLPVPEQVESDVVPPQPDGVPKRKKRGVNPTPRVAPPHIAAA